MCGWVSSDDECGRRVGGMQERRVLPGEKKVDWAKQGVALSQGETRWFKVC